MRNTTKSHIVVSASAIVLTSLIAILLIRYNLATVSHVLYELTSVKEPLSAAAYEMEINVVEIGLKVLKYLNTGNEAYRHEVVQDNEDFLHFQAQYDRLAHTPEEKALGARLGELYQEFYRLGEDLTSGTSRREERSLRIPAQVTTPDESWDERLQTYTQRFIGLRSKIDDLLDEEMQQIASRDLAAANHRAAQAIQRVTIVAAAAIPALAVLGLAATVLMLRSLSQRQQLEQRMRASEKLAATARVAAGIAHEINNPLAGIKNSFMLVKDAVSADHPHYEFVGRIEREIDRIAGIVRQMYSLYKPHQDAAHAFSVHEAVTDTETLVQPLLRAHDVHARLVLPPASLVATLPEASVRQVLLNLLANAIEASPAGAQVTMTVAAADDRLHLVVADHGCGMTPDVQAQLFEPFFTTKTTHARGGLGLGLSITKSLVETMGGAITFISQVGRGTEFQVALPCAYTYESGPPRSAGVSPANRATETVAPPEKRNHAHDRTHFTG